jgi:putative transposase
MDFVQNVLFNVERFRVDNYSKICHGILVVNSLNGIYVVEDLSRICTIEDCKPLRIQCNNGTEFVSKDVDLWTYSKGLTMDFSSPGKPKANPYVESFKGKFRDECLNVNWFLSLKDPVKKIEDFRWEYNHFRPYSSINDLTPKEFVIL